MTDQEIATRLLEFYGGKPERWTQRTWARDASGDACELWDPGASCWCIAGAVEVLGLPLSFGFEGHFGIISRWNDQPNRTFADVERKLREIAGLSA